MLKTTGETNRMSLKLGVPMIRKTNYLRKQLRLLFTNEKNIYEAEMGFSKH
jgi:hypothetical protein